MALEWMNKQLMGISKEKRQVLTNGGELGGRKEDESDRKDCMAEKLCDAEGNDRFEGRGMHHSSCKKLIAYRHLSGIIHRNN